MLMFCSEQLLPIVDVLGGDAADQGIAGVAVGQEGADGEEDLGDREGGGPLGPATLSCRHRGTDTSTHLRMSRQMDPLELMLGW